MREEEEDEEEERAAREEEIMTVRLEQTTSTAMDIEAERQTPEPQSLAAILAEASAAARQREKTPRSAAFDASQEGRHRSESGERGARSTKADGNEAMYKTDNLLAPPKQPKRISGDLNTDARESKSRRKGPSKAPGKSQQASR
jgi:hypothetical protein